MLWIRWWWGHLVRFLSGGGVVVAHLVSHLISSPHIPLPAPSNLLYPPFGALRLARPPGVFMLFGLWLRDEENSLRYLVETIAFGVREVVTLRNTDLLVEYPAVHLNSQGYLYALFERLWTWQHFYFELLQSLSLAMQSYCFRVAKISFYIEIPRWFHIFTYLHYKTRFSQ